MEQRYEREYYRATRRGSLSAADLQDVDQAEHESTLKELIIRGGFNVYPRARSQRCSQNPSRPAS